MSLIPIVIGAAVSIVSILVSLGTVYYLRRKDKRETHEQSNGDVALALQYKDDLIQALKDDREELKNQLKLSNERNERLEGELRDLRDQLRKFESESRTVMGSLLESFAQSERCLKPDCGERIVPGDRRDPATKSVIVSAGGEGTD